MKLEPGLQVRYYRYVNGASRASLVLQATVLRLVSAEQVMIACEDGKVRRVNAENLRKASEPALAL